MINFKRILIFLADKDYKFSIKLEKNSKRSLHHGHNVDEKYVTYNIKLADNNKEGNPSILYFIKIIFSLF